MLNAPYGIVLQSEEITTTSLKKIIEEKKQLMFKYREEPETEGQTTHRRWSDLVSIVKVYSYRQKIYIKFKDLQGKLMSYKFYNLLEIEIIEDELSLSDRIRLIDDFKSLAQLSISQS